MHECASKDEIVIPTNVAWCYMKAVRSGRTGDPYLFGSPDGRSEYA